MIIVKIYNSADLNTVDCNLDKIHMAAARVQDLRRVFRYCPFL